MNAEDLIGKALGTCTLQQLIGQGGMGAVFLAQQSRPRRQVAVKVLFPFTPLNPGQKAAFLERFRRETDAAASLVHPNIMPVHEYGEQDGLAYLVMPYLSGGTLRDVLEREGRLPLAQTSNYLEQLAAALEVAHGRGVIHRDLKPANVMLTQESRLVLTDFGLVKILSDGQSAQVRLTGAGAPLGTPDYMSPEQVIGTPVDIRADLYSLGCVLYHMVTGSLPFKGALPMQVAMQHLNNPPSSPRLLRPDLPVVAEQVILRTLAKRPEDRYANASEIAGAFREALISAGVSIGETLKVPAAQGDASFTKRGLFDPMWQQNHFSQDENSPQKPSEQKQPFPPMPAPIGQAAPGANAQASQPAQPPARNDFIARTSMTMPSFTGILPPEMQAAPVRPTPVAPALSSGNTNFGDASFGLPNTFLAQNQNQAPNQYTPPWGQEQSPAIPQEDFPQAPSSFGGSAPSTPRAGGLLSQFSSEKPQATPQPRGSSFNLAQPSSPEAEQNAQPASSSLFSYGSKPTGLLNYAATAQPAAEQPVEPAQTGMNNEQQGMMQQPQQDGWGQQQGFAPNWPQPGQGKTGTLADFGAQYPEQGKTGLLAPIGEVSAPGASNTTSMMRLVQPARVFKIPVAGKPGQYVTGMLPQLPAGMQDDLKAEEENLKQKKLSNRLKSAILIVSAALIIFGGSLFWLVNSHTTPQQPNPHDTMLQKAQATSTAQAGVTATAQASNIYFEDPLDSNTHSWPIGPGYTFKDGAYHIKNTSNNVSTAILQDFSLPDSFVSTITMNVIKDNDSDAHNEYGVILRYQKDSKGKRSFYLFDVRNFKGGRKYQFWKYSDSRGTDAGAAWKEPIWEGDIKSEYKGGHNQQNVIKIGVQNDKFTFYVNGKQVGNKSDNSLKGGQVGMLVYLKDTEVAFSNLALTRN
ncbi:serine/threonine protein kinase [Ktedonobacter racemifer]|uniref:non-specific serine/threonine protein kinase n=1 Tax=Ktedonobacter racemifer DSM 44963 TaxID=485913 RepID=D6TMM4_KTERA|nr:serine/threonine-protein kinase [Ktedonobacter racemifer]EFH87024.1 serine/threonine protein kinase [Ktedonobacter racemifer DSM 44963]